jgi:hypothetical protein
MGSHENKRWLMHHPFVVGRKINTESNYKIFMGGVKPKGGGWSENKGPWTRQWSPAPHFGNPPPIGFAS